MSNEGMKVEELTRETDQVVDAEVASFAYSDLISVNVPDSPATLFPDVIDLAPEALKTPIETAPEVLPEVLPEVAPEVVLEPEPIEITPDQVPQLVIVEQEATESQAGVKIGLGQPAVRRDYVQDGITTVKYGIGATVLGTVGYGIYSVVDAVAGVMTSSTTLASTVAVTLFGAATAAGVKYRNRSRSDETESLQLGADVGASTGSKIRPWKRSKVEATTTESVTASGTFAVQRSTRSDAPSPIMLAPVSGTGQDLVRRQVGRPTGAIGLNGTAGRTVVRSAAVQHEEVAPIWWSKSMQSAPAKPGRFSEWTNGDPIVVSSQSESRATDVKAASQAYWDNDTIEDDSLLFDSLTRMWIMLMRDPNTEQVVGSWIGKEKFKPCEVFGSTNKLDQGARCAVGHLLQIVDPDGWNPHGNGPVHNDLPAVCDKYGRGFIWDVIRKNDSGRYTLPEIADYVRDELAKRV